MPHTAIQRIQGPGLFSPLEGETVTTRGVVIGASRKGYFVQDPDGDPDDPASHGIFVFARGRRPRPGGLVEVSGKVVDYQLDPNGRPTTQLVERRSRVLSKQGPRIEPVWLTAERVLIEPRELAALLNGLEGMLVGVSAESTFVAPSNPFGDYVLLPPVPPDADVVRTQGGGVLIDPRAPERWLPGFRVLVYDDAPTVHVGAQLLEPIVGPLNFRADSYQIAASGAVRVRQSTVESQRTTLQHQGSSITVLTLNGFNLDTQKENPDRVNDPDRDVDDDIGDRRFIALGRAIVKAAACPTIVALQEMQDNDGAELSGTVSAQRTYERLIAAVKRAGGPTYAWADIAPEVGADGGQPGGNIRNGFLFDAARVSLIDGSLRLIGADALPFEGSRKPLVARFRLAHGKGELAGELEVINVHLASKRHQNGTFAPEQPGFDPRRALRVQQAELIGEHLGHLRAQEIDYYVTGDFNDFEFSPTLQALIGDHSINLVDRVPKPLRYDYNHRGMSQALMHGVVAKRQVENRTVDYEILHENALSGTQPGRMGDKASDHAYVIARLQLV